MQSSSSGDGSHVFAGREGLVETLAGYVEEYETFSNVCCEKIGYSLEDIHRTLDKLKVGY